MPAPKTMPKPSQPKMGEARHDVDSMSYLPKGWTTQKLGELGVWSGGGTPSKQKPQFWENGTIPWVSPKDMKSVSIDDTQDHITEDAVKGSATKILPKGSLLVVTRSGILQHTLPVATNSREVTLNQDLKALTPKKDVDVKYLYYALRRYEREILHTCCKAGTTVQSIEFPRLKDFPIPIAPLSEQRRIVARIEELFSRLDAGVAALRKAKAQLQRYRRSVLAAAVTGQLTQAWREQHPDTEPASVLLERVLKQRREKWRGRGKYKEPQRIGELELDLPSTWATTNIDSLISGIEAGKNFKCEERPPMGGETGLVKISAVTWGKFNELESKTVTQNDQIREEHIIHPGDFLLSRANTLELVGAPVIVGQITRRLMLSDKVLRFRFIERHEKFALIWLRSKFGRKEIESRATGNQLSMRNIGQESIRAISIPLPPHAEQIQIVAEVAVRTTAIDHMEAELNRQITRSNRLRQSTLAAVFSGNPNQIIQ